MIKAQSLHLKLPDISLLSSLRDFLRRHFFSVVAVFTFILIVTAQMFWSTIHGDGAVYAWITKEMAFGGVLSSKLPNWDQSHIFAEHPYLFFYFGSLFVKLFGLSDITLKLPNFLIAAASVFSLYKLSRMYFTDSKKAHALGLIAGYVLLLNSTYIMQISQPSLDPLAQFLGLLSVIVLIFEEQAFLSGLILGLAFLTKGLELLPNFAASVLIAAFIQKNSAKNLFKNAALVILGTLIPVMLWLTMDHLLWGGQWLSTYWSRQFTNRFLQSRNMQKVFDIGYLNTVLQVYFLEMIILGAWLWTGALGRKKNDPLFLYFIVYAVFNILAFLIIKKDSTQHLTGILLIGALFVAEALWDIWEKLGARRLKVIPLSLLVMAITYWMWFIVNADRNPDIWTTVKNESSYNKNSGVPVVIHDSTRESYGLFHTAQWYSQSDQVFFDSDADRLEGKQVLFFSENGGQLISARVIYKKGQF
jgi:4-amino-4-deoxy-L-arabinose transferase-like glycosyltransferase